MGYLQIADLQRPHSFGGTMIPSEQGVKKGDAGVNFSKLNNAQAS